MKEDRSELLSLQKQHSKQIKLEQEKATEIKAKIKKITNEITTNEGLAYANKNSDKEFVKNLKDTIAEFKNAKLLLEKTSKKKKFTLKK